MAQYFTDFSEYTIGEVPADWTVEWGSVARTIVSGNPESSSTQSLLVGHTGSAFSRNAISWSDVPDAAAVSVFCRLNSDFKSSGTDNGIVSPVICGRGSQSTRSGYYAFLRGSSSIDLKRASNGSVSTVASTTTIIPDLLNVDLSVELSVSVAGQVELYVWLSSDAKPASATLAYTDPSPLAAGWPGFLDLSDSAYNGSELYFYGVGTDGDSALTAPIPTGPATPTNLGATNILTTSARLTWEQG